MGPRNNTIITGGKVRGGEQLVAVKKSGVNDICADKCPKPNTAARGSVLSVRCLEYVR